MEPAEAPRVPSYSLDLSNVPTRDREAYWRRAFGGQWDMPDLPPVLEVEGRAFDLGKAVLADTVHPSLNFARDKALTRRDGVDNIYILTQLTGAYHAATDDAEHGVEAGCVTLFDIARPVTRRTSPGRTLCLAVSRESVEEVLPGLDVHALTLGAGGAMMAEHLRSLRTHLPSTDVAAAPHLVRSSLLMLAACVLPTAERLDRARPQLTHALLTRAKRFIRAQCQNPDLSPALIAASVGASRASLYRAFEPEGGVAEFVRRARLEAARAALLDVDDARRVGDIAFAFGFSSEAHFSRAVRTAFGVTPTELRKGQGGLFVRAGKGKWVMRGWAEAAALSPAPAEAQVVRMGARSGADKRSSAASGPPLARHA